MAASGIAEHNEARRLEMIYLRKAWLEKQAEKQRQEQVHREIAASGRLPSSYEAQVMARQNRPGPCTTSTNKQHQAEYEQMQKDYSAKLNKRYSSLDYISQW